MTGKPAIRCSFFTKVAGVSWYQAVVKKCQVGDDLYLEREPDNPVDENAIAVYHPSGKQLGYIRANVAVDLALEMDDCVPIRAIVKDVTGGTPDKPMVGLNIEIIRGQNPQFSLSVSAKLTLIAIVLILSIAVLFLAIACSFLIDAFSFLVKACSYILG